MQDPHLFARVAPELEPVLEELRPLEPIFHTAEFGMSTADFERRMALEYWEVGASGRRYSRDFILQVLRQEPPVEAGDAGWVCSDYGLRQLGPETYQITYTLHQWKRVTRRSTLWRKSEAGWQILFHQGTIVTGQDNTVPAPGEMPRPSE
jgi:hypothetical protein